MMGMQRAERGADNADLEVCTYAQRVRCRVTARSIAVTLMVPAADQLR